MITAKRKRSKVIIMVSLVFVCLVCGWTAVTVKKGLSLANQVPFFNPPDPFDKSLLAGTWGTEYSASRYDILVINNDGTFRQIYHDQNADSGNFETPWNKWWIERLSDGRMYLHLEGAKFFLEGMSFADKLNHGYYVPCPDKESPLCEDGMLRVPFLAYDWIGGEYINMAGELILNIRVDPSGSVILVHMWSSSDAGFPIIGGESEIFRKVSLSTDG